MWVYVPFMHIIAFSTGKHIYSLPPGLKLFSVVPSNKMRWSMIYLNRVWPVICITNGRPIQVDDLNAIYVDTQLRVFLLPGLKVILEQRTHGFITD